MKVSFLENFLWLFYVVFFFSYYLKHFSPVVGGFFLSYLQPQKYRQLLLKFKGICSLMVWIIWTSRTLLLFCQRFSSVIIGISTTFNSLIFIYFQSPPQSENLLYFYYSPLLGLNIHKYFLTKSKSCWYLHLCSHIFLQKWWTEIFCSLKPLQKISIYCTYVKL